MNIYLGVDRSKLSAVKAYLKSDSFLKKKFNGKKLFFNNLYCTAQFGSNYGIETKQAG